MANIILMSEILHFTIVCMPVPNSNNNSLLAAQGLTQNQFLWIIVTQIGIRSPAKCVRYSFQLHFPPRIGAITLLDVIVTSYFVLSASKLRLGMREREPVIPHRQRLGGT
ncbi:hypothetical protein TcWFU_006041 [Taenia crassiceps]|uniref:Uncharacterized protein n=1 Tax=Taenia crassiceps TaxID=6207 RepID=A0ABR4QLR3_9CEST